MALLRVTVDKMVVDCNPYVRNLTGKNLVGLTLDEVFNGSSQQSAPLDLLALVANDRPSRHHLASALGMPLSLLFRFIAGPSGEVLAIGWHDVVELLSLQQQLMDTNTELNQTVRRETKDKHWDRERRDSFYRCTLDSVGDGVVCLDREGLISFVNLAAVAMLGYSGVEELIGKPGKFVGSALYLRERFNPDGGYQIDSSLVDDDVGRGGNGRLQRKDGNFFPVAFTARPIIEHHRPVGFVVAFSDASERTRADDQRKNHLLFLESLIEAIPAAVFYMDSQGICLGCNQVFADLAGQPISNIIGRASDNLLMPTIYHSSAEESLLNSGEAHSYDFVKRGGDGDDQHLRVYKASFELSDGSLGGMIGIILDISADNRREQTLREARQAADRANQAKSDFLANMSHEIRTPMTAILGLTYLLAQTELSPSQREYVTSAELSAQSLLGILNDILDLSKIEAGRLNLEVGPFHLNDIIEALAAITAANTRDKNIEVTFLIAPGTPNFLVGDAQRLQQVLLNLIGNAIKFTSRGEVVLTVETVQLESDGVRLAFSVRDTGIGIASGQIGMIFDPFTQADTSTSRTYGGTGLGLSISRRLVTLMDGEITVDSNPGGGSTFLVIAPFQLGIRAALPAEAAHKLLGRLRVLVADDNPTASNAIATMAAQFGWTVTVAASGRDARDAIDRSVTTDQRFDLAILDWLMPDCGGNQILHYIDERYAPGTLSVIAVATASEHDRVQGEINTGPRCCSILTKPVTSTALIEIALSVFSLKPPSDRDPINKAALSGCRLLLVEDNLINQMVARRILESVGAKVITVSNGNDALLMMADESRRVDAILMDIQMPGMDGYETCRRLRMLPSLRTLPVIAMTANALASDRERCLAAGMNDHIAKPLDVDLMIQVILSQLGRLNDSRAFTEAEAKTALARCNGDTDLLMQILEEFINQFADEPEAIARHLAEGDLVSIGRKAHQLRGVVGSIGGHSLLKQAAILQSRADQGELELARVAGKEVCRLLETALVCCAHRLTTPPRIQHIL